ncbi:MAG: hypothetical protein EZS28_047262, partial [Streblomastix strix]
MRIHPWVTCNGTHPLPVELEKVDVTENEINFALTPLLPWSKNEAEIETDQEKASRKEINAKQ